MTIELERSLGASVHLTLFATKLVVFLVELEKKT